MIPKVLSAAVALAATRLVSAQTFTSCDPLKTTCPEDPALGKTVKVDFTKGASSLFTSSKGTNISFDPSLGAVFAIEKETDAPTITSNEYIFFGKVDVVLRAAPGQGVVTSFVLQSDDLDEIDWEWLGGDTTQVQTNYFGKGDTSSYTRGGFSSVATPQATFHMYTIDWTKDYVKWSIDGNLVRTLNYADAEGGSRFPQTPMQIKLGTWDAGASTSSPGTVAWAGGYTDFKEAPFLAYYQSIRIQDYSTGATSYSYGDKTGSYQSIKVLLTNSQTGGLSADVAPNVAVGTSADSDGESGSSTESSSAPDSTVMQVATTAEAGPITQATGGSDLSPSAADDGPDATAGNVETSATRAPTTSGAAGHSFSLLAIAASLVSVFLFL